MARIILDDEGDLDEYVRRYRENTVQEHVKRILDHQLKNVVTSHLAKLRLTEANSPAIGDVIDDALSARVKRAAQDVVPAVVKDEMQRQFNRMTGAIK